MKLLAILTILGLIVTFGDCGRSRVEDVTSHEKGIRNNRRVMEEGPPRRPGNHEGGLPGFPGPNGPQGHHGGPPQGNHHGGQQGQGGFPGGPQGFSGHQGQPPSFNPFGSPNSRYPKNTKSGEESGEDQPPRGWKLSGSSSVNGKPPKDRSDLLINAPHSLWDTVNLLSNFVWRFFLDGYHFITHAFRSDFDHWRGFRFSNLLH